ncbi:MAG TPA: hypothetical protein VGS57_13120 [Thermoanaerobaculia bacterium]|jgi:hypothetical protein|nr:hypothetical protein [Thermoanaerobaculia bacterium]
MAAKSTKAAAKKSTAKKGTAKKAAARSTGARTARSIRSADLQKLTQAAVRATTNRPAKIVREPIWGFVLDTEVGALDAAQAVTRSLAESARGGGIDLKAKPAVLLQPGITIAGFIQRDLNIPVRF